MTRAYPLVYSSVDKAPKWRLLYFVSTIGGRKWVDYMSSKEIKGHHYLPRCHTKTKLNIPLEKKEQAFGLLINAR